MKSTSRTTSIADFVKILENVTKEEKEYLTEALGCAEYEFCRASIVVVWNAVINRMYKMTEKLGLMEFNRKSEEMKVICDGRFKRFKKSFNVHSLSELRATVSDADLLWVLEYWRALQAPAYTRCLQRQTGR